MAEGTGAAAAPPEARRPWSSVPDNAAALAPVAPPSRASSDSVAPSAASASGGEELGASGAGSGSGSGAVDAVAREHSDSPQVGRPLLPPSPPLLCPRRHHPVSKDSMRSDTQ